MNLIIYPRNPYPHSLKDFFFIISTPGVNFLNAVLNFIGVKNGILVNSGREALFLILKTLLKSGDEIIVPAFTCNVLIGAMQKADVKPVFADVNKETLNMEYENIIPLISDTTRAILVTHQFGYPTAIDNLIAFCKNKNILIIEDAAPAFGARYNNKLVGIDGDIGFYSFEKSKVVSAIEGGIIVGKENYLNKIKANGFKEISSQSSIKYGIKSMIEIVLYNKFVYNIMITGWGLFNKNFSKADKLVLELERYDINYKAMSKFQQKIGFYQLKKINEILDVRKKSGELYREELRLCKQILDIPQSDMTNKLHTYSRFPILVKDKNTIYKMVKQQGVDLGFTFSYKLSQYFNDEKTVTTNTDYIISHILCVPITNNFETNKKIIKKVKKALNQF